MLNPLSTISALSANAISAKVRAIYGRRLTAADYQELTRQRTVSDVAAYLKANPGYGVYLAGIDEMQIHRGQLELLLHRSKLERLAALAHYSFAKGAGFYSYTTLTVEADMLLRVIMLLNSNVPEEIIRTLPTYMQEFVRFDFLELSRVRSFEDLLRAVEGTPYRELLEPFRAENGQIRLSQCELALKTYAYQTILDTIDKSYTGAIRRELREAVLTEADLINLVMIYRLRTYFGWEPEQVKSQLLPFRFRLTDRAVEGMLAARNDEAFSKAMRLRAYRREMEEVSFSYMEQCTRRLSYLMARKRMHFSTEPPIVFYSLMTLIQLEVENVTTIIEGIRYGLPQEEIEPLLIL